MAHASTKKNQVKTILPDIS